jgi:hypothetical protein
MSYTSEVLAALPSITNPENAEIISLHIISTLENDGFTVNEAIEYCKCLEEINPDLDESVALNRMYGIRLQVKARMQGNGNELY